MTTQHATIQTTNLTNLRPIARLAGTTYLVLFFSGIFAEFLVRASLLVPGDAAATTANIVASLTRFRLAIAGDLVMIVCDVALAALFYVLLRQVSQPLSLAAAFFRLIQAAILSVNLLNLFFILQMVSGAAYVEALGMAQREAWTLTFFTAHALGYALGLVFFGVNCLLVGYLIIKSGYLPRLLGYMMLIAGAGYLVDSTARLLLPTYGQYADIFGMVGVLPAVIAEFALALWLLIKGVNVAEQQARASQSLNYGTR